MSRILEYQHSDEQTIVARILLELHQAIDENFPNVEAGSRQFTKTLLTNASEHTGIDQQPSLKNPAATPEQPQHQAPHQGNPAQKPQTLKHSTQGMEFSQNKSVIQGFDVSSMEESWSSRWLTRTLVVSLICGLFGLAWLYMFGAPF